MIDDTGARNGGSTPGGSEPDTKRELLGDGLPRAGNVLAPVELDPHDRDTDRCGRAHATYSDGAIQRRFNRQCDHRLDLERIHARRFDEDRDRRRRQIGEHIERHARRRPAAPHEKGGGQRHHDRAMRERPANQSINHQCLSMHVTMGRHLRRQRRKPDERRAFCDDPLAGLHAFEHLHGSRVAHAKRHRPPFERFAACLHKHDRPPRFVYNSRRRARRRGAPCCPRAGEGTQSGRAEVSRAVVERKNDRQRAGFWIEDFPERRRTALNGNRLAAGDLDFGGRRSRRLCCLCFRNSPRDMNLRYVRDLEERGAVADVRARRGVTRRDDATDRRTQDEQSARRTGSGAAARRLVLGDLGVGGALTRDEPAPRLRGLLRAAFAGTLRRSPGARRVRDRARPAAPPRRPRRVPVRAAADRLAWTGVEAIARAPVPASPRRPVRAASPESDARQSAPLPERRRQGARRSSRARESIRGSFAPRRRSCRSRAPTAVP